MRDNDAGHEETADIVGCSTDEGAATGVDSVKEEKDNVIDKGGIEAEDEEDNQNVSVDGAPQKDTGAESEVLTFEENFCYL